MVVNGSLSKTAVNGGAGARTQLSGLVVAVMTVITLLFLTGLFEKLPEATLAAVVIAALIELVDIRSLRTFYGLTNTRLGRIYGVAARPDFIAATAALFGVLIFDTLPGLFIGIVVSIVLLVYRTSRPHVAVLGQVPGTTDQFADIERHTENRPVPGVVILRPESSLFFANAERVRDAIRSAAAEPATTAVVLDLGTVPDIDLTAARMLADTREELAGRGLRLLYARDVGQVRDMLGLEGCDRRGLPVGPRGARRRRCHAAGRGDAGCGDATEAEMSHIPDDPATDPEGDITDTAPDETTPEALGRSMRKAAMLTAGVGILFSVLFTVAFVLLLDLPAADATNAELIAYYSSPERVLPVAVGLYLLPFAGIAFLWFIVALRLWSAASTKRLNNLQSNLQLISGIVFVSLFFVGAAAMSVLASSVQFADGPIDPVAARQFPIFGKTVILFFAMRMAAMFVFTSSALGRSAKILPGWFAWVGVAVGVFLLFSATLTAALVLVFPAWVAVLSLILLRTAREIPRDVRLPAGAGGVSNPLGLPITRR